MQTDDDATTSPPDVVTLRWERPRTDGGSPLYGYLVEHRRTGSPHWVRSAPTLILYPEVALSGLEPGWRYQFRVAAENAVGMSDYSELSDPLTVTLQRNAVAPPRFVSDLQDCVAIENEKIEFHISLAGSPPPQVNWFKDGFEVFSSRRTKIVNESNTSTLIIHQTALTDEGEIKCTATNRAGHVVTKALLRIEAPPKIRLPRQYEDGLLIEADEVVRLKVGLAGRPAPIVVWSHNGEVIRDGGRYELLTNDKNSSLKISNSLRADRGEYHLRAINKLGDDNVSFLVTVTDRPSMPGKVLIAMSIGRSATLSWTAPDDDGGCKIGNYVVEYFRIGWNVWLKAVTTRQLTATLNDLIEGSEYKFRVKAESPYGMSDPSEDSDVLFVPDPKRGISKPEENDIALTLPPKKRYLSPRRNDTAGGKPEKIDKQEQTKKSVSLELPTVKQPRQLSPQVYDSDVIAREMSYGTASNDGFLKDMELKHDAHDERLMREMTYDTNEDTYNPRRKVLRTPPESPKIMPTSILKNPSPHYNENLRISIDEQKELHKKEIENVNNRKKDALLQQVPAPESHDEVHTSNEFVLVLYDNDDNGGDHSKADRKGNVQVVSFVEPPLIFILYTNKLNVLLIQNVLPYLLCSFFPPEEMSYDTEFDSILPPQLSLSTPELGLEAPPAPAMRRCVSSTELLYEKAMQRFYQAVKLEESERTTAASSIRRSESVDPRPAKKKLGSFGEADAIAMERRNSLRQKRAAEEAAAAKEQETIAEEKIVESDPIVTVDDHQDEDDDRDLKKEILESQRRCSSTARNMSPASSVEFEEDYTDSTASSAASMSSLDSMEKFKNAIRTIGNTKSSNNSNVTTEKFEELDTYNPMMSSRTVSSSNIRTIDDDLIDTSRLSMERSLIGGVKELIKTDEIKQQEVQEECQEDDEECTESDDAELEEIYQHKPEPRTLSPYRTPDADQATIALTKPLSPPPNADYVPKPILKRPVEANGTKKKADKEKTKKTERKSLLQMFKKNPSQDKAKATAAAAAETPKMSAAALARKKSMEQRQSSLEENKVAIDHYSDIVKELSTSVAARKPKVPIYLSTEELKIAAEKEASERDLLRQKTTSPPPPVDRNLKPTLPTPSTPTPPPAPSSKPGTPTPREPSATRSIFAIKLSKDPKKIEVKPEVKPLIDMRKESRAGDDQPMYVMKNQLVSSTPPPMSPPPAEDSENTRGRSVKSNGAVPKKRTASGTRSNSALRTKVPVGKDGVSAAPTRSASKTRVKSQSKSPSVVNRRPLHVARIALPADDDERQQQQSPERSQTPEQMLDEAEKKVKSTMVYFTDISMLIVACWVYVFKDARLVLPILALMVYRQASKAMKNKIPKWMKRKSQDDTAEPEQD